MYYIRHNYTIVHNYAIAQVIPHAMPQTHSAFYPHPAVSACNVPINWFGKTLCCASWEVSLVR